MITKNYICSHCKKTFAHETRYLKHKCKAMRRLETIKTMKGQRAAALYREWMSATKHPIQNESQFLNSKYFDSMVRVASHISDLKLPDNKVFVRAMVKKKLMPSEWLSDIAFNWYLEYYDIHTSPLQQFKTSLTTLVNLAEDLDVRPCDLFEYTSPNVILQLLRQRKLSLWFLMNSAKFKDMYSNEFTRGDKRDLNKICNLKKWQSRTQLPNRKVEMEGIKMLVQKIDM